MSKQSKRRAKESKPVNPAERSDPIIGSKIVLVQGIQTQTQEIFDSPARPEFMIKPLSFSKQAPDLATKELLISLEREIGFNFPPVFSEFCYKWNGGFVSRDNELYPVPHSFHEYFAQFGAKTNGVVVSTLFGATRQFPQCSILRDYNALNQYSNLGIIPIGANLWGCRAVLRLNSPLGYVYWWDHDRWEEPENAPSGPKFAEHPLLIPIANDLQTFYNALTIDPDRKW